MQTGIALRTAIQHVHLNVSVQPAVPSRLRVQRFQRIPQRACRLVPRQVVRKQGSLLSPHERQAEVRTSQLPVPQRTHRPRPSRFLGPIHLIIQIAERGDIRGAHGTAHLLFKLLLGVCDRAHCAHLSRGLAQGTLLVGAFTAGPQWLCVGTTCTRSPAARCEQSPRQSTEVAFEAVRTFGLARLLRGMLGDLSQGRRDQGRKQDGRDRFDLGFGGLDRTAEKGGELAVTTGRPGARWGTFAWVNVS